MKQKDWLAGPFTAEKYVKLLNQQVAVGWLFDKVVAAESRWIDRDTFMLVFYLDRG